MARAGELSAGTSRSWMASEAALHALATLSMVVWQAGVYVDVWYHLHRGFEIDSFLTWAHAFLYAGWATAGLGVLAHQRWTRAPLPRGYRTYLLGIALFGLGGGADFVWHSLFGFEVAHDAILSASHMLLTLAFTMAAFGLLEGVAHWRGRSSKPGPDLRLVDLPLIVVLGMLLRVTFWYVNYVGPLTVDFATGGATSSSLSGFAGVDFDGQTAQIAGAAGILLHSVILALFLVGSLHHLRLPVGSIAIVMLYDALLVVPATDQWLALPAVGIAALVGEAIWSRMQRGGLGGIDGEVGYWMVGAMVPLVQCATHFALLGLFGGGLVWTVHLWAGAPAAAGLLGLTVAVLVVPPAFIRVFPAGR